MKQSSHYKNSTMKNKNSQEFSHPRLVSIFDIVNPIENYRGLYASLVNDFSARSIVDFGCGTWLLTCEFIAPERIITGIDPFPELIESAKARDVHGSINWLVGSDFDTIADASVDMILLSGHVSQFLITEIEWTEFLRGAQRILRSGWHLLFESRNPDIEPFANWPTPENPKKFEDSSEGPFSWWWEEWKWEGNIFSYSLFYDFKTPKEIIESRMSLIFRSKEEILFDTRATGFELENLFGDWEKWFYTENSEEMIFLFQKL